MHPDANGRADPKITAGLALALVLNAGLALAQPPDLILHHGKIVTCDPKFSLVEAVAIRNGRILAVGPDSRVLASKGDTTRVIDLEGRTVLPGLMDSHTHPVSACMYEFDHPIPEMNSIDDVLAYVRGRAEVVPEGTWITVKQVFITRLREQRYPTRAELDRAAPRHPVVFSTIPDASVNSLALSLSGIDRDSRPAGVGLVEKDARTGEPTGILRGRATALLRTASVSTPATRAQQVARLAELFHDYNRVGITAISDRNANAEALGHYHQLLSEQRLTVRIAVSHGIPSGTDVPLDETVAAIRKVASHPLRTGGPMLRIIGVKAFQDGGMLTGSAAMLEPWGISAIYSITDPGYRGVLFIPKDRLLEIVRAAVEAGLQFTAHSVGDAAVTNLVDVYEQLSETLPVRETRPCVTHCNFMTADLIARMARLGVFADIQPAWLYLDARTLQAQFGYERLAFFQPLQSIFKAGVIVGGGSDHMQKIGSLRAINPYNPFLGIWVAVTRQARWQDSRLHPEQALTREQAIRFYTANNAHLMFLEQESGSLEPGKAADLIVIDRDILTCPEDDIRDTVVLQTYLAGKLVHEHSDP